MKKNFFFIFLFLILIPNLLIAQENYKKSVSQSYVDNIAISTHNIVGLEGTPAISNVYAFCGSSWAPIVVEGTSALWEIYNSTYLRPITPNYSIIPNGIMEIGSPYKNGGITNIYIATNSFVWGMGTLPGDTSIGSINWYSGITGTDVVKMMAWGKGIYINGLWNCGVNELGNTIASWGTTNAKDFEFHLGGWCGSAGKNSIALYNGQTDGIRLHNNGGATRELQVESGDYGAWTPTGVFAQYFKDNGGGYYINGTNDRIYDNGSGLVIHSIPDASGYQFLAGTNNLLQMTKTYIFMGYPAAGATSGIPVYLNAGSVVASTIVANGSSYWCNSIYTRYGVFCTTIGVTTIYFADGTNMSSASGGSAVDSDCRLSTATFKVVFDSAAIIASNLNALIISTNPYNILSNLPVVYSTNSCSPIFFSTDTAAGCVIQSSTYTWKAPCNIIVKRSWIGTGGVTGSFAVGVSTGDTEAGTFVTISTGAAMSNAKEYNSNCEQWKSTKIFPAGTIFHFWVSETCVGIPQATYEMIYWKRLW